MSDLIIEILSPSTRVHDLIGKAALYADQGVAEYWIVDPDRETVDVNVWQGGSYMRMLPIGDSIRSSVLPELTISASEIFGAGDREAAQDQERE